MATEGLRKRAVDAVNGETEGIISSKSEGDAKGHPAGKAKHGALVQALRIVLLVLYFLASCVSIFITQLLGSWLYIYNQEWYYAWMAVTKQHFALLMVTMQQWWAPIKVRLSWDASMRGQFRQTEDGRLETDFPERIVLIANHQIYTDWVYLWWIAYTSRLHGHIFIILKQSLKYIPLLGQGMQFFSFVFMSRKWESDKPRMAHRLTKLSRKHTRRGRGPNGKSDEYHNPMWLLIFPEGTNASNNGRRKSKSWADKQGIADTQHVLLPRSTGLQFCLQELADTVEYVYDCTVAYDGVPRAEFAQDIYTLNGMYFKGKRPASVDFYWRRFRVADIPYADQEAFGRWLLERWREKDALVETYLVTGRFPADVAVVEKELPNGVTAPIRKSGAGEYIETEVKPKNPIEFLQMFLPWVALALAVNVVLQFWRIVKSTVAGSSK